MSKKALGRGIQALIQEIDKPSKGESITAEYTVSLELISPNPFQPRKEFKEVSLQELAASIKEQGLIQPLVVEKKGNRYIIIAGERRYRAAKIAGLSEIPVIIRIFSDEEKLEIALVENIQREDLNPIEEASAYKQLMEGLKLGQEEVALKVGKNRSTVANSLRLLKLPEDMQRAVIDGELSSGHARSILSVVNPADQRILFTRIISDQLSVREAEQQAASLNKGARALDTKSGQKKNLNKQTRSSPEVQEMEQRFLDILGTKVSIKGNIYRGKIEISYYSMEDLERVYSILNQHEK